uniref:Synaptonemal complex protein 2 Spt16M-like domain-containing protein n=1 Tax=Zonotrichia albicollis TaxID=44394 RepID=A0A8D2LZI1_ZONAL
MLNTSYEVCFSSRVYSFPCISAFADMNEAKKPSDEKLEEFWIDFNVGSQSVTFYVDCDEGALWDSVRLSKENINTYSVKEKDRKKIVRIFMKIPTAINKTEAIKFKLVFSDELEILAVLRKVLGDEKLMIFESEDEIVHSGKEAMQNEAGDFFFFFGVFSLNLNICFHIIIFTCSPQLTVTFT